VKFKRVFPPTFASAQIAPPYLDEVRSFAQYLYLFGQGVHMPWPHAASMPFAYAIVGMGALLAGAT